VVQQSDKVKFRTVVVTTSISQRTRIAILSSTVALAVTVFAGDVDPAAHINYFLALSKWFECSQEVSFAETANKAEAIVKLRALAATIKTLHLTILTSLWNFAKPTFGKLRRLKKLSQFWSKFPTLLMGMRLWA